MMAVAQQTAEQRSQPPEPLETQERAHEASVVARFFAALNRQDPDGATALFAPEYTCHLPGVPVALDRDGFRQFAGTFFTALPDVQHTIEDEIVMADRAAARVTVRGTHNGDFQGIPPTGRAVTLDVLNWYRLANGRIAEQWISFDSGSMLQQLGVR